MKGIGSRRRTTVLGGAGWVLCVAAVVGGAGCRPGPLPEKPQVIPHGYVATLQIDQDGRRLGFGPFVGYYFRPPDPADLRTLTFVCFNERQFYTLDLPDGEQLFEGTAVRATLPDTGFRVPRSARINPVFFPEAPHAWPASRPVPRDEFVHFHSCYDAAGSVRTGYWLRHVAVTNFTYDMGGRVGERSPLFHAVTAGVDTNFARIIEFDRGPDAGG